MALAGYSNLAYSSARIIQVSGFWQAIAPGEREVPEHSDHKTAVFGICRAGSALPPSFAAEDPFIGTWREIPSEVVIPIFPPGGDAISIQKNERRQIIFRDRKDISGAPGNPMNFFRLGDHSQ